MHRTLARVGVVGVTVVLALSLGSCQPDAPTLAGPQFWNEFPPPPPPPSRTFTVCKVGTSAMFTVTLPDGTTQTITLAAGECQQVASGSSGTASAAELAADGITLDSIVTLFTTTNSEGGSSTVRTTLPAGSTSASVNLSQGSMVATFYNHGVSTPGRMTGGGRQITIGDVKVTRGFTIHCDITLSNNIEVNWPDNHWHLTKPITSAICIDDPAVHPEPPPAPFDTFIGEGEGEWNGQPGATIRFVFVDAGEPGGKNDLAQIRITAADGTVVLDVPLSFLDNGNIQAHYDQPHKNKP